MVKTILKYSLCISCVVLSQAAIIKAFKQHRSHALAFSAKYFDEQGRYDLSLANASDAYNLDQFNDIALFYMANASYKQNDFQTASRDFENSIYLPHQTNRWRALGISLYNESKYHDSAEAFQSYVTVIPSSTGPTIAIYRLLALSLMNLNRFSEAMVYFNKNIGSELNETAPPPALQPAMVNAIFQGSTETARFYFDLLKSKYPNEKLHGPDFLSDPTNKEKMTQIAEFLAPIWDKDKSDPSVAMILAAALNQTDKLNQAESILKEAKNLFPQDSDLAMINADLLFRLKRPYDAKAEYERHLSLRPDSPFKNQIQARLATIQ